MKEMCHGRCGKLNKDFYKDKRVFITGNTGFKGSWLSIILHMKGAIVKGYSLKPPTNPSMYKLCGLDKKINSTYGDIRDKVHLSKEIKEFQPDIIFHLAAQPLVRLSYQKPSETFEINIMGIVNLFEALREVESVRAVLNVTTDKCYENKEGFWGYRENDVLGGYDPYSSSKACSELITGAYRSSFFNPSQYKNHKVAIATARAGNVIGGGDFSLDRLIPDIIRGIQNNEKIPIRNPQSIRPWQHVLDPLTGYLILAEKLYLKGSDYGEAWNFGPKETNERDVLYIISKLCSLFGYENMYHVEKDVQPHETSYLKLDSYKSRKLLGYMPKLSMDEALEMTAQWYRVYMENSKDLYDLTISQIKKYEEINSFS